MSIEILSRSVGDTAPPMVTDGHGNLSGALVMLAVMYEHQMALAPHSTLEMPRRSDMIAALDTDRPAIIVPSEGMGADTRDIEIFIRTWKAEK